jgi:hypothetical protein
MSSSVRSSNAISASGVNDGAHRDGTYVFHDITRTFFWLLFYQAAEMSGCGSRMRNGALGGGQRMAQGRHVYLTTSGYDGRLKLGMNGPARADVVRVDGTLVSPGPMNGPG